MPGIHHVASRIRRFGEPRREERAAGVMRSVARGSELDMLAVKGRRQARETFCRGIKHSNSASCNGHSLRL